MSGLYWGLTALDLMNHVDALPKEQVVSYIQSVQHEDGGFGGHLHHDSHILYTLSAIQVMVTLDALDAINVDKAVDCKEPPTYQTNNRSDPPFFIDIVKLQNEDGSFSGDKWGELDSRFSYIALSALSLMKRLDAVDVPKAVEWILLCKNYDGGFGSRPGSESHAAQIFCCLGALAITKGLHHVDVDLLSWWLCERQLKNGGLNGRPEKLEDVMLGGGQDVRARNSHARTFGPSL